MRRSNATFATVFLVLAVSISVVLVYRLVPYNAVVTIVYDVSIMPYTPDHTQDYGTATLKEIHLDFSRYGLGTGSNRATKILSFPYGELAEPLHMSLNLTLLSSNNRIALPTANVTFSEEGQYTFVYFHPLPGIQSGNYLVNLTFTEYFRESFVRWASVESYVAVE